MKLHFKEEDLSERQDCKALPSNLEETALICVIAKKQYQRDTVEPFRLWGPSASSDDALRETKAT